MERGALSTPEFNAFSKKVVPFLHITTRIPSDPYQDLLREKGGRGFPTFKFLNAKGDVIVEPQGRSVADWEAAAKEAAAKMPPPKKGDYTPAVLSLDEALKQAKKEDRVVILLVSGDSKPTGELTKILYSNRLKKQHEPVVLAEIEFKKDDETLKKLGVTQAPALLALDPRKDKLEEAVLDTYAGKPSQSGLAAFLKKWEKGPDKK